MTLIDFPSVEIKHPKDVVVFYDALRKTPEEVIDVCKVVINNKRSSDIIDKLFKTAKNGNERCQVAAFWVIYGPSVSAEVPYNKIGIRGA
jgi:site-specific DNA-adenine methylase